MTGARRLWGDRRGASALEFALVAPLLLFVIVGLLQLGLLLYTTHVLNESVAAGARALYFNMADQAGATSVVRKSAGSLFLNADLLSVSVKPVSSPYPALQVEATYPFTGIGVGLPEGKLDIVASAAVAIAG